MSRYTVVGIVPIAFDVPCFATPVFRDNEGQKHFVQNLRNRNKIVDFQHVGEIPAERIVRTSQNEPISIGDRMLVGFRHPDGTAFVDNKGAVLERLLREEKKFRQYPFFYFYLARHAEDGTLMREALRSPRLSDAISKGWINVPKQYRTLVTVWTPEETQTLREAWAQGFSASEIARRIGNKSRNSVVGKVHRLGLPVRSKRPKVPLGQDPDLPPNEDKLSSKRPDRQP